ncbi:MAG TPA: S-layer homology domain-containing protein [Clostridiales bacterium]|nr:S-layer homology domain-containing protein [Clostridiales bacterium]
MKKRLFYLMLCSIFTVIFFSAPLLAAEQSTATGINVQYHTQAEIRSFLATGGAKAGDNTTYGVSPSFSQPFSSGSLSSGSLYSALAMVNQIRYIAGVSSQITLNTAYNGYAQDAAFLQYLNGTISHAPSRPAGVSDSLYNSGYKGASSSNVAMGYATLNSAILSGWMGDSDSYNLDRVGHRRWILYPELSATGFGAVEKYYAMYVFDSDASSPYYGVAWPAQNMPMDYFANSDPWSISMGQAVDINTASVQLVRLSDGHTWNFSKADQSDGYFNVNNDTYGDPGCIIFRPNNISYAAGDSFSVTVSGLSKTVTYQVNFFSLTTSGFSDVPDNQWYAPYVTDLAAKGILSGKSDGIFDPNGTIKRGEFAKILATASREDLGAYQGNTKFSDVAQSMWYAKYIQWASAKGIVNGTSSTTFAPEANITRQEMAVMIKRYADYKKITLTKTVTVVTFADSSSIASWARDAVSNLQQAGIINGTGGNQFNPLGNATRAEAAKMISLFLKLQ